MTALSKVTPMLALPFPSDQDAEAFIHSATELGGVAWEPKLDGMRCLYHQDGDEWRMRSRNGLDISRRFASAQPKVDGAVVLDGEMIAFGPDGRTTFNAIQRSHGRRGDPQPSFVVFDILWHPEHGDVTKLPWAWRKEALSQLDGLQILPHTHDGPAAWKAAMQHDMEGVMAKATNSTYKGGRHQEWMKVKRQLVLSAIVTGFDRGEGARAATFGALNLALHDGETLVHIADVGSGFTEADLRMIAHLKPPFVVDVAYQEWTGQALRFPVFKGVRPDIEVSDCTVEQQLPQQGGSRE